MQILVHSIWWGSITLEVLLLLRAVRTKTYFSYPFFYAYVSFVLTQSFLRLTVYHYRANLYSYVYWTTEFIGVVIGCGIVYEIYRLGLV